MTSIGALRAGLAANMAAVDGLRVTASVPDDPKPPVAVVLPPTITFDQAFGRGLDEYEFVVLVIVGRVSERTAQSLLDAYSDPTGPRSIKTAIEADRTLAGSAADLRVTAMRGISQLVVAENTYLAAEFTITVYAN